MSVSFLVSNPIYVTNRTGDSQAAIYTVGDAVLESLTEKVSRATKYPTQFGVDAADHIVLEPIKYTLKAATGTTPLGLSPTDSLSDVAVTQGLSAGGPLLSSAATVTSAFLSGGSFRGQETWEFFSKLWQGKERFDIQTGLELIPQVVITYLSAPRDYMTSNSIEFDIVMEQIPISTTDIAADTNVSGLPSSDTASTMGQPLIKQGQKALRSVAEVLGSDEF